MPSRRPDQPSPARESPTASAARHNPCRLRSWKTNALLLTQAVFFVFLIWAVDKAITNSRQRQPAYQSLEVATPEALTSVPDCINNIFLREGQPCYSFLYSPAVSSRARATAAAACLRDTRPRGPGARRRGRAVRHCRRVAQRSTRAYCRHF